MNGKSIIFFSSALLTRYAPLYKNSFLTSSYTSSTTITDCSEAQIIPLSNVFDIIIEETAILISAVSSITAAVFPGPTPKAGLPDE